MKKRRVSGVMTLILRHPNRGTCTVAEEWTDRAKPALCAGLSGPEPLLDATALIELAELLDACQSHQDVDK